jgi:type I restriction enzyme, S subunit
MSSVEGNTLPDGWDLKPLGEIVKLQNGFAFKRSLYKDQGSPIIRIKNIKNERVKLDDVVCFNPTDYNKDLDQYKIEENDILIAMSGATTGKIGLYKRKDVAYLNQRVGLFRIKNGDLRRYLLYFLSTQVEENLLKSLGAAQPNLSSSQINEMETPIPPLEEQKRIVAKIDTLFAKIDKAISLTEESLKQAKNLLPRIIDETFDSFDAEKVDLKSVSDSIQYGYTGKTIENGKYYYLRITDIQGGMVNYQSTPYSDIEGINIEKYKLNKGDILFARTGATAGKSYLFNDDVEAVFASYLIRVVCNQDIVKPSFVKWFFLSANYWKQIFGNIVGAAQPNFNGKKLGELNLKIPSIEQQELVIGYLEKVSKQTKETQSKLEEQLAYLKQLKSSILSKAFKGEL